MYDVLPGFAGEKAGIQRDDVVLAIEGKVQKTQKGAVLSGKEERERRGETKRGDAVLAIGGIAHHPRLLSSGSASSA